MSLSTHEKICRHCGQPFYPEAVFLARYIEKFGTGTLMMIRESVAHGLSEPDFEQRAGEFVTTVWRDWLWRDWLTEKVLATFDLNDRQRKGIAHLKTIGSITSREYQVITGAPPRTTTRDLDDLVSKGLLQKVGEIGRGTHYVARGKSAINQPNRPSSSEPKRAVNVPSVQTARARHKPAKRATAKSAINRPIRPGRRPAR